MPRSPHSATHRTESALGLSPSLCLNSDSLRFANAWNTALVGPSLPPRIPLSDLRSGPHGRLDIYP